MNKARYQTFAQFYPFYLTQHQHPICRALHIAGVIASFTLLVVVLARHWWLAVPLYVLPGYALGWIGHFVFEKNKPASFEYPAYSFVGDIKMTIDILAGRQSAKRKRDSAQHQDLSR
jgi:hypothetical protein